MNIQFVMEKAEDELPGYKLVGYFEKGFPQFKRRLLCLMLKGKRLPVVDEFVLRLYKVEVDISEMHQLLGLDAELIKDSWYNLVHYGLIHEETKTITELGNFYLAENKIDDYVKVNIDVCIDAFTGKVSSTERYTDSKSARQINLDVLSPMIQVPTIETIDKDQLKKVITNYKIKDPDNYDGRLIEVLNLEGRKIEFKRMYIFIFSKGEGDIQFLVYDGAKRREEYEYALKEYENKGFAISCPKMGTYFDSNNISYIDKFKDDIKLSVEDLFNTPQTLLQRSKKEIYLSLPLIEHCIPSDSLINIIEKKLHEGVKINCIISGREFISLYQKGQFQKLINLRRKTSKLDIFHVPVYQNKAILIDGKEGIVSNFTKHELKLPSSVFSITEYGYLLSEKNVSLCINGLFKKLTDSNILISYLDPEQLKHKVKIIAELIIDLDNFMVESNGIGWIGEKSIPNLQQFFDVPLCKNENQFKLFISSFHISLIESIDQTGKSKGNKQYFWNEFMREFPDLQRVLHKIRLYRHSTEHIALEDRYKEKYYEFLDEDLNGAIPFFVENGYLILQTKLLNELENTLRINLNKFSNTQKNLK